jgi:hypothetical protein
MSWGHDWKDCHGENELTLGCRLYLRFVVVAAVEVMVVGAPGAEDSTCLTLDSGGESSLLSCASPLAAELSNEKSGRSADWPRNSAIALCSFYYSQVSIMGGESDALHLSKGREHGETEHTLRWPSLTLRVFLYIMCKHHVSIIKPEALTSRTR